MRRHLALFASAAQALRPAALFVVITALLGAPLFPAAPGSAASGGPAGALRAQLTTPLDSTALAAFRWRAVGPANMSGRITDVEGIPTPSKTFFVAAAAGGIWKTTNNGITFRPLFTDQRVVSMGDMAIAPSDTLQIWAGTGEEDSRNSISPGGGIYKSTDGGLTWELKGLEGTEVIGRIVVHPTNPDRVWVAALGHIWDANPERGLYRTDDGGETWELVKFVSDKAGFVDIVIHPEDPDVLWATSWERVRGPYFLQSGGPGSGLWKTTDGGDTWEELRPEGFPTGMLGRIGLDISRSNPDVMYALVEAEETEEESSPSGLYRSSDGGESWERTNSTNTRPFYYSQVRVDPQDPDRVYWSSTPVQVSDDGGYNVGTTTNGIHVDHHAMWIDPVDPERMVVGNDGGVGVTFDKGGNWLFPNVMPLGQFYEVSYGMEVPYTVCGGLQDNGSWCGPSRVKQGSITNYMWYNVGGGDGFFTLQDPDQPEIVYYESQGGNMGRINTRTSESHTFPKPSWKDAWLRWEDSILANADADEVQLQYFREMQREDSAAADLRWNWNTPMVMSPHDPTVIYAGANRVVKYVNRGEDPETISPDLSYADAEKIRISTEETGGITPDLTGAETFATIVALAESPLQQGLLLAGTDDGRAWMSPDDGESWEELTDRFPGVPQGTWVRRVEPSPHDVNTFFVAFDGHRTNDFTPYVYVTEDGGETFRSIAGDLPTGKPDFVHVIRQDPVNPNLLFVGTDVGVYVSTDMGGHWQRFMTGLPTVPVHDLKIHPRDHELIAGTHGRSIWIVDIAPLQQMTDRALAAEVHLFDPKPSFQYGSPRVGGESAGHNFFSVPTAPYGAELVYRIGPDADIPVPEREEAPDTAAAGQEPADTAAAGERPAAGGFMGMGRRNREPRPQVSFVILDAAGDTVNTLTGPGTEGVHRVRWNFQTRMPETEETTKSPAEVQDSIRSTEQVWMVVDSLVEEGVMVRPMLERVANMLLARDMEGLFAMFGAGGGGGSGSSDPEEFNERPGERWGGGGFSMGGGMIRQFMRLVRPLGGFEGLMGGASMDPPLAESGEYTVVMKAGDEEYRTTLTVTRGPGAAGDIDPTLAPRASGGPQVGDSAFLPELGEPAYLEGQGPRILMDEAHNNFHTVEGRYQTTVRVLRHDGFVVEPNREPFTPEALAGADLLLVANALADGNVQDWSLPTPSAFTSEEIRAVKEWVEGGGSLFLIADHMPFPGAAAELAAAFGVEFLNGFATDGAGALDTFMFRRGEGTLLPHPVTDGLGGGERVDSVLSLTGQAFRVEPPFEPILMIPEGGIVLLPDRAWEFSSETDYVSAEGLAQGAVGRWGEGRVAVWGEAAMFSAQVSGAERRPMGMNLPEANQNPRLLLNLVRWLTDR